MGTYSYKPPAAPGVVRGYQRDGGSWLSSRRYGIIGDSPGLGKTLQAVRAADLVDARSVLVAAPTSVRRHWAREFARWSRRAWHAQIVETVSEAIDPATDLVICSYATVKAPRIFAQLVARRWDVLIPDEVQGLRTAGTRQTVAVYGRRGDGTSALLERAEHCWGLSGSICPNGWARELYTHLRASGVTELTAQGFDHRYHVLKPTQWGDVPVAHRNLSELKELLRGVYLRRRIEEVAPDLPSLAVATTPIEADTAALLEAEGLPALAELRAALAAGDDAEVLHILEHASGDVIARLRHGTGMLKVPGAVALLHDEPEADPAHKVVAFGVHRGVIRGLAEGLADFGAVILAGATRPADRQAAIDRFATDPACRAFVAQIVAGGTGISLVAAHHVTLVESSWAIADNLQAIARCRRFGQEYPVLARYLYVPGSLDEAISAVLARKSTMSAELETAA